MSEQPASSRGIGLPQVGENGGAGGPIDGRSVPRGGEAPLRDRVAHVVNLMRPAVQADGGDLELVEVTGEGVVKIRLHGACVGCPSSSMTLQMGLERNLREHVPEVTEVRAME